MGTDVGQEWDRARCWIGGGDKVGEEVGEEVGDRLIRLARHGESSWNVRRLIQGQSEGPVLTARGRHQARALAREISRRRVACIFSSDLRRAAQTAARISAATGVVVVTDQRLRERSMGALEGGPDLLATPALSGVSCGLVHAPSAHPPGGESLRDLRTRVAAFVADRLTDRLTDRPADRAANEEATAGARSHPWDGGGDTVIVAHGGTVRMLEAVLSATPLDTMEWKPVANASLRDLEWERPRNRYPVHCTGGAV